MVFLTDIRTHIAVAAQEDDPARAEINAPIGEKFKIKDTKLYVLLVASRYLLKTIINI